nr:hypothetical protein GCM10025699_52230 [Microbacterium flavescens]
MPIFDSRDFRAMPIAASHLTARSILPGALGRLTEMRPEMTPSAQRMLSSRKAAGPNCTSTIPSSRACAGFSVRLFFSGFSTMTRSAFSMPIRLGSSQAPPQPGMIPRKTSGRAIAAADESTVR